MEYHEKEKRKKWGNIKYFSSLELMKELARMSLSPSINWRLGHCNRGRMVIESLQSLSIDMLPISWERESGDERLEEAWSSQDGCNNSSSI